MQNNIETETALWLKFPVKELTQKLEENGYERLRHKAFQKSYIYTPPKGINPGGIMRVREVGSTVSVTVKSAVTTLQDGIKQRYKNTIKTDTLSNARVFVELVGYKYSHMRERFSTKYKKGNNHLIINYNPYGTVIDIDAELKEILKMMDLFGFKKSDIIHQSADERWRAFCKTKKIPYDPNVIFDRPGSIKPPTGKGFEMP
ncbi:hypothetical protein HZA44_03255 [Candidatus Peregrinibacteria bacterium]|nr:hypothetical protein [Candidatus Peregrinibacteria bacterium]